MMYRCDGVVVVDYLMTYDVWGSHLVKFQLSVVLSTNTSYTYVKREKLKNKSYINEH